jgi:hypothetical protein
LKGLNIIDSEGNQQGVSKESVDRLANEVLSWLNDEAKKQSVNSLQSKADQWEAIFGGSK